jgi:hypothetical protein
MRSRDKASSTTNIFRYINLFMIFSLLYGRHVVQATKESTQETACDFLEELGGEINRSRDLYKNNSYSFDQHKKCKEDKSEEATRIKRHHDADTMCAFEKISANAMIAAIYGSSSLDVCDPLWGDAARASYKFGERDIVVFEGGGASIMEAARLGMDIFSLKLGIAILEGVIALRCEYKTATPERKGEIESYMKALYGDHELDGSYSVHAACWLSRMPAMPYFGIGGWRAELYTPYAVLDITSTYSDIMIDFESPTPSEGTNLEAAAGNAQVAYKPYLSPDRNQLTEHYGPSGYNRERHNRKNVKHAKTLGQLFDDIDYFVKKDVCDSNSSFTVCKNAFYHQQEKLPSISVVVDQNAPSL